MTPGLCGGHVSRIIQKLHKHSGAVARVSTSGRYGACRHSAPMCGASLYLNFESAQGLLALMSQRRQDTITDSSDNSHKQFRCGSWLHCRPRRNPTPAANSNAHHNLHLCWPVSFVV